MLDKYMSSVSPDIPRLLTALAEWCACMVCLSLFPRRRRVRGLTLAAWSFFLLLVLVCFLVLTEGSVLLLWFPCMVGVFLIMFLFLSLTLDLPAPDVVYRTCMSFMVSELAASLTWQIDSYGRMITGRVIPAAETAITVLAFALVFGVCQTISCQYIKNRAPLEITWRDCLPQVILTLVIFSASNLSFVLPHTPFTSQGLRDIHNLRTAIDLAGVAIIYAFMSRLYDLRAERELLETGNILKAQYETYRSYQESIDLINMKYHDLKHQLDGLRGETDPVKREAWIDAMEEELRAYKPERQTGSPVLDTILSGKMVRLHNSKITFTCVADGKLLDFLHVMDICTIFGNALDNAIEAAALVEEEDRRMVHMSVSRKKQFLMITVRNTMEGSLNMGPEGEPLTTKQDTRYHGFGLKSIRQSAAKYGGTIHFEQKEGFFTLQILIPIPRDLLAD